MKETLLKIKLRRVANGFNQSNMGYELGISQYAYCKLENGKTKLTLEKLKKIASVLKCDMKELL